MLSRRDFLKLTGAAGALAASGLSLDGLLSKVAAQAATPAATASSASGEISFMGWGGQPEDEGVRAAVTVFEKANPSITVDWIQIPTQTTPDFTSAFLAQVAAGTAPDTAFVDATNYETFSNKGLLADITAKIMSDPQLGAPNYFIEPQEKSRCADDSGKWHGIGACWVAPHLYFNADMLDKAG